MSETTIKVRVIAEKGGFIYGRQRLLDDKFTLKPVEHSTDVDSDGEPVVIPAEQQFSERWMVKVDDIKNASSEPDVPVTPSGMNKAEIVQALTEAGIPFANGQSKKELVVLLEDHQAKDPDEE